jgi:hypothetical protein
MEVKPILTGLAGLVLAAGLAGVLAGCGSTAVWYFRRLFDWGWQQVAGVAQVLDDFPGLAGQSQDERPVHGNPRVPADLSNVLRWPSTRFS